MDRRGIPLPGWSRWRRRRRSAARRRSSRRRSPARERPARCGTRRRPAAPGAGDAPDNDPFVTAVEHRLQCTCGCTLDVYTCRTTDFTCTYSPALHKEVLALQDQGKTADEIVAAFVAKYGEKVLMAPKPEGFNLAGYVVPGWRCCWWVA